MGDKESEGYIKCVINDKLDNETENNTHSLLLLPSLIKSELSLKMKEHGDDVDALPSNLQYTNFDLLCTVISILTYLFDLAMDCIVAFYFYHLGIKYGIYHYWYFGLTVTFILLPSFTMTGFSLRWYLMDSDNIAMEKVSTRRWILRLVILFFQFAPILRYIDSIRFGILSRYTVKAEKETQDPAQIHVLRMKRKNYFTLMVYEDADATLLRLFECFMESAPQLVLQIYILLKDPRANRLNENEYFNKHDDNLFIKTSILGISIMSSLVSLAWSLVVYHRSLRYTFPNKNNINVGGSIFQFLWHFLSITARVLALSLFASIYPMWIGPVCGAHWIIMASWVIFQRTEACRTPCEEFLFAIVLGAIYIFSFFNAKEERTRFKYLIYYGFCFLENAALIVIWFLRSSPNNWYYYPGIIGHYFSFFGGVMFMIVYYSWFHPTGIDLSFLKLARRQSKPKKCMSSHNLPLTTLPPISKDYYEKNLKSFNVDINNYSNNKTSKPISASSRCLSSPILDDVSQESKLNNKRSTVRRSSSAPSSRSPILYHVEARRLKDMAGRFRV
ncbi:XK-related protein 6 [Lepeophtheirus salmonis]|uniref:XK-related protein 6 n=1 Tax=Lepeophtheirus salmonis TaxID=72036 RepID=UPI001AE90319|nr:XK-related protein 6-like [Lepeophtheirus salmonis]